MTDKLRGTKQIFCFTLIQGLKSKSIKISTIILCAIVLCVVPVMTLISKDTTDKEQSTKIKKVFVLDMLQSGMNFTDSFSELKSDTYGEITYEDANINLSDVKEDSKLKDIYKFEKNADYVYLVISTDGKGFISQVYYDNESKISKKDAEAYSEFLSENFGTILSEKLGITKEQAKVLDSETVVTFGSELLADEETKDTHSATKYSVIYGMMMVMMFVLAYGGERIAMSIIVEKSSKIIDMLLVSVKPMAIVVGKICANLVILFVQIGLLALSYFGSIVINGLIFNDGKIYLPSNVKNIFNPANFAGVSIFNIILAILMFVLGFVVYGMIAGIAGASVSKTEDISEGIKMYTFILIVCAYAVIFFISGGMYTKPGIVMYLIEYIPLTAVMFVPAGILTGYVSLVSGLISTAILCVTVVLVTIFVANIYESIIYYNGKPLKIKDIIRISKEKKAAGKRGEM